MFEMDDETIQMYIEESNEIDVSDHINALNYRAKLKSPAVEQIKQKVAVTSTKPQTALRANVGLLDTLMTLAGELVLSRNQFRALTLQTQKQLNYPASVLILSTYRNPIY